MIPARVAAGKNIRSAMENNLAHLIEIKRWAKKVWDYHHLNHKLLPADCIIVLGSNDTRVAERGAELFLAGFAPLLVFSGGFGRLTLGIWPKSEAEMFADIAIKMGVPENKIIVENKSTNTGENILFTKELLEKNGINLKKVIVVQKPYMERRTYATFKKIWPQIECIVTSPQIPFEDYCNGQITIETTINAMVGDLQRIKLYPEKGFQIGQTIPTDVSEAYEKLVAVGYSKDLIKD